MSGGRRPLHLTEGPSAKGVIFDSLEWSAGPLVIDVASGKRTLLGGWVPRDWLTLGNDFAFRTSRSPSVVAGLSSKAFEGEYSLVVSDRAGDPQRALVAEGNAFFLLGAPRWSPKSDEILYRHIVKVGQIEFFVADLTGAHTRVALPVRPFSRTGRPTVPGSCISRRVPPWAAISWAVLFGRQSGTAPAIESSCPCLQVG